MAPPTLQFDITLPLQQKRCRLFSMVSPASQLSELLYSSAVRPPSGSEVEIRLRDGLLAPKAAFDLLAPLEDEFALHAGRIALEIAYGSSDPTQASAWVARGTEVLEATASQADDGIFTVPSAEAKLLLTQMPSFRHLSVLHEMPKRKVVSRAYRNLVDTAHTLSVTQREQQDSMTEAARLRAAGVLAEFGVLALAQRAMLHELAPTDWFPVPAFYSEDIDRNRRGDTINRAWDVSIYRPGVVTTRPTLAHRIQVKSSNKSQVTPHVTQAAGISLVRINPDLTVSRTEQRMPVTAILLAACYYELPQLQSTVTDCTGRIGQELDARTARLLRRLENNATI